MEFVIVALNKKRDQVFQEFLKWEIFPLLLKVCNWVMLKSFSR